MSIATAVKAWVATLNAGGFISHGQSLTVTVNLTAGWEIQVPVGVRYGSGVSLASAVFAYPSNDGGATFDTEPIAAMSVPATASVNKVGSLRLTTGIYAIQVQSSSPSTTFFVLTQEVITAFNIA
jgi:hypothetical protein